jgi:pyruvate dehydrogenase E2 component (dihydrolipoamide acetyltransferase)
MAEKIVMPQGGQDLQFGTVVHWLKNEGETVSKGELICEVETEKAVFEVVAPRDGILLKIIKQDGEEAEVLSAIGYIGDPGETIVIDEATIGDEEAHSEISIPVSTKPEHLPGEKLRISPKARKLARDHGIDITQLKSNRSDGKITTEIVQSVIRTDVQAAKKLDTTVGHPVKMGRLQRIAADRLSRSWREAPHIFLTVSADVTELLEMRKDLIDRSGINKVSVNDLIVRAAAIALKEFPEVNASYFDEDTIILWEDIHIGIATSTEDGLLVPVLANADRLSLEDISRNSTSLIDDARNGKFSSSVPSRFTISNLGMHGVDRFTAIINPPESAILAVGSAQKKVVVDDADNMIVRNIMEMTLSLDHRVGDGVLAAVFINRIKALLEDPGSLWDKKNKV